MTAQTQTGDSRTPPVDWKEILDELSQQLPRSTFDANLAGSRLVAADGDRIVVELRHDRARQWVENRLQETIERTVRSFLDGDGGRDVTIEYTVAQAQANDDDNPVGESRGVSGYTGESTSDSGVAELPDVAAGQVGISKKRRKNPTGIFLQVPHYALRFWRPLIGAVPFALYEALNHYHDMVYYYGEKWPTIAAIVEIIGQGTRHTILGRGPTGDRPAQKGAVDVLVEHRLAYFWTTGEGRGTRYYFKVFPIEDIEVLTPKQLSQLSNRKQKEHDDWLPRFPLFDAEAWAADTRDTRIPEDWWEE